MVAEKKQNGLQWITLARSNSLFIGIILIALLAVVSAIFTQQSQLKYCDLFEDYEPTRAEVNQILIALGKSNLNSYRLDDAKIRVPSNEKVEYLSAIQEKNGVPTLLQPQAEANPNPFLPRSQQAAIRLNQKKKQIREMVLRLPFVREAWFEMDWATSDSVYQPDLQSAVAMVIPRDGKALTRQQVVTIQGIVSGACAKIQANEVVVTDANMGVSYDDLNDHSQARLIELVNWQVQQRTNYLQRLQNITEKFPGVQIDVEVTRNSKSRLEQTPIPGEDKKIKFAAFEEITLNGEGTVGASNFQSNRLPSQHQISQVAHSDSDFAGSAAVNINVRVPAEFSSLYDIPKNTFENQKMFNHFKVELINEIKLALANTVSQDFLKIEVVLLPGNSSAKSPYVSLDYFRNPQVYWPFVAIVLIGLTSLGLTRRNEKHATSSAPATTQNDKTMNESDLQEQLTTLIDKDPDTAAKVIKNWIRDAA